MRRPMGLCSGPRQGTSVRQRTFAGSYRAIR